VNYHGEKPHFLPMAILQAKRSMAALRVRSRMLSVQRSLLSRMTPRYFAWLLRARRVWCSFGRIRFGTLYFLVKRTSSVFSGITPSPQTAVYLERVVGFAGFRYKNYLNVQPPCWNMVYSKAAVKDSCQPG